MSRTVGRWTGVPISVGLGPTKTLAKLANRLAKKGSGCQLVEAFDRELLARVEIEGVWGVGHRWGKRLRRVGVKTALDLAEAPTPIVRSIGGVTLERTHRELGGLRCFGMEESPQPRKNVCSFRSFGRPVTELSTGQQQRVAVARALIGAPPLVIADEPTSALDTDARHAFLDLLFREVDAAGATLIFVSHDRDRAGRFHRTVLLGDINRAA